MSNIGNKMEKKAFGTLAGTVCGFTMGNEFNSLSKTSVLCGTEFQEYPPYQDSPEDSVDALTDALGNIMGNILGGLTPFASVLGNEQMFLQTLCIIDSNAIQSSARIYNMENLVKVVADKASAVVKSFIDGMVTEVKEFIPHKVPNNIVLGVLEGMSEAESILFKLFPIPTIVIPVKHSRDNKDILLKGSPTENNQNEIIYQPGEYIENQKNWTEVRFGITNMSYAGCEIIATYNALKALGEEVSEQTIVDLILMYECDGAVLGGGFGTSPYAVEDYFIENGYDVVTTTSLDTKTINEIGESSDTVIVSVYNDKDDIMEMIHTVCITKDMNGQYSVHNAYNYNSVTKSYEAKDGYYTLQDAINAVSNKSPSSIDVIGISNPHIGDFPDSVNSLLGGIQS